MGRVVIAGVSVDERMRQNWIQELKGFGVTEGKNGESLQNLNTYELRGLVLKEYLKRD